MLSPDELRKALRRAFHLGQIYWQQADSESRAENRKAEGTQQKFDALLEEAVAALGVDACRQPEQKGGA